MGAPSAALALRDQNMRAAFAAQNPMGPANAAPLAVSKQEFRAANPTGPVIAPRADLYGAPDAALADRSLRVDTMRSGMRPEAATGTVLLRATPPPASVPMAAAAAGATMYARPNDRRSVPTHTYAGDSRGTAVVNVGPQPNYSHPPLRTGQPIYQTPAGAGYAHAEPLAVPRQAILMSDDGVGHMSARRVVHYTSGGGGGAAGAAFRSNRNDSSCDSSAQRTNFCCLSLLMLSTIASIFAMAIGVAIASEVVVTVGFIGFVVSVVSIIRS